MDHSFKGANEVSTSSLEQKFDELTDLMRQVVVGKQQQANAVGVFPGQPSCNYNPYSNTYNPGWEDHPNLNYEYQDNQYQPTFQARQQETQSSNMSLEEIVKSLATNTLQFQNETRISLQNLESQVSQLATSISQLEVRNSDELSSQNVINPCEDINTITLRSEREIEDPTEGENNDQEEDAEDGAERHIQVNSETTVHNESTDCIPFPCRLSKSEKDEQEKDILDTLRKVPVNIPLLDAIEQIPRYAKILKDLCNSKKKLNGNEWISVGENVSAMIQRKLPPNCKDPGMFTIPCMIGNIRFEHAMLDLGASINVMPHSIYASLNLGPLKDTGIIIELADRYIAYPDGMIEDVLVQINGLIFPADFLVVYMDETSSNPAPILLGWPFFKTEEMKIDVDKGTLTMELDDESIKFNLLNEVKHFDNANSVFFVDKFDVSTQESCKLKERSQIALFFSNLLSPVVQIPKVELKIFKDHLKYVHLGSAKEGSSYFIT